MKGQEKGVRQSVSLPARLARRVRALAKNRKTSTNRVLVELIETGIESKEAEKSKFFELADQLSYQGPFGASGSDSRHNLS